MLKLKMNSETVSLTPEQQLLLQLYANVRNMRQAHGLQALEFIPPVNSPLSLALEGARQPVWVTADEGVGIITFVNKVWDRKKLEFFTDQAKKYEKIVLVDVGANVGLFTRQLATSNKNLIKAYCYEPHPRNFEMLQKNLSPWNNAQLINSALSNEIGTLEFYVDPENAGNYSLNKSAMVNEEHSVISVSVNRAADEEKNWLSLNEPILYKSDTQGFDEIIATDLSLNFWSTVRCASLELWRVAKPDFDETKFVDILDLFPFKAFEKNPQAMVSSDAILDYCKGLDGECDDVLCWH
jgi:FkbM family methyltransferase